MLCSQSLDWSLALRSTTFGSTVSSVCPIFLHFRLVQHGRFLPFLDFCDCFKPGDLSGVFCCLANSAAVESWFPLCFPSLRICWIRVLLMSWDISVTEAIATVFNMSYEDGRAPEMIMANLASDILSPCQGASETGDMLCPSTHGALMYMW